MGRQIQGMMVRMCDPDQFDAECAADKCARAQLSAPPAGKPADWFSNLATDERDKISTFLSQSVHHYGAFSIDVIKDVEAKFGIAELQIRDIHACLWQDK